MTFSGPRLGRSCRDSLSDGSSPGFHVPVADDARLPQNWQPWRKWVSILIVSYVELLTHLTSLMYAPGISEMQKDFNSRDEGLANFSMTVYVLGFGVGPLICSPLSELYGRVPIYRTCVIIYLAMSLGCALSSSLEILIAFRFFAGCSGAAPVSIGGAVVADLFASHERGRAMSVYQMGYILGLTLGPPVGAVIIQKTQWRWVFWTSSILTFVAAVCAFGFLRETHAPTITRRLATAQRLHVYATHNTREETHQQSTARALVQAFQRPLWLLLFSTNVLCIGFITAVSFGIQNTIMASLGSTFQNLYAFDTEASGLVYLGLTIGFVIGALVFGCTSDKVRIYLSKGKDSIVGPKFRLLPMILNAPIVAGGLFWYGWTMAHRVLWIVPVLGLSFIGFGLSSMQLSGQTYFVDSHPEIAASALAANTVARSVGGSLIPLAGPALYNHLGLGWGSSLLAFVSLALCGIVTAVFTLEENRTNA